MPVAATRSPDWAPHELAATVNEIIKVVGLHPKYGYRYWLGKVKRSGKGYGEMAGILKEISGMDAKYPKGATLTNKLSRKINGRKQNTGGKSA
jgi:hypothetical protein